MICSADIPSNDETCLVLRDIIMSKSKMTMRKICRRRHYHQRGYGPESDAGMLMLREGLKYEMRFILPYRIELRPSATMPVSPFRDVYFRRRTTSSVSR